MHQALELLLLALAVAVVVRCVRIALEAVGYWLSCAGRALASAAARLLHK